MEVLEYATEEMTMTDSERLETIYRDTFPVVAQMISNLGGNFTDAKDIFHDALIVFMEKGLQHILISEKAYITGIAKHLWIRKFNKQKNSIEFSQDEMAIDLSAEEQPTPDEKKILRILEIAGEKCMSLLRAVFYKKSSLANIAVDLGYSNEHSLSVQKHKCLKKIRNVVKQKSMSYEDFTR